MFEACTTHQILQQLPRLHKLLIEIHSIEQNQILNGTHLLIETMRLDGRMTDGSIPLTSDSTNRTARILLPSSPLDSKPSE